MNISSSNSSLNQLLQLMQTSSASGGSSTSSSSSAASSAGTSSTGSSDSASLSGPGELFQELQSLSTSNPTEFKKITAEISQELQKAASSSIGSGDSNFLSQMASNFAKASQSGNFSDLFPSGSQQAGSSTGSADATGSASAPPPRFGHSSSGTSDSSTHDTISTIFSNALSQIQSDLSSIGTSTSL